MHSILLAIQFRYLSWCTLLEKVVFNQACGCDMSSTPTDGWIFWVNAALMVCVNRHDKPDEKLGRDFHVGELMDFYYRKDDVWTCMLDLLSGWGFSFHGAVAYGWFKDIDCGCRLHPCVNVSGYLVTWRLIVNIIKSNIEIRFLHTDCSMTILWLHEMHILKDYSIWCTNSWSHIPWS